MSPTLFYLAHFAVLAYALVGGVFLAFSDFIMRALSVTSGQGGAEAMQAINREVYRWVFMVLFLGMAPVSLLIAAYGAIVVGQGPGTMMILAGLIYLVGCFGVTVFFNVPMNEALALVSAAAEGSVRDGLSILDQAIAHADMDSGADASGGLTRVTAERVRARGIIAHDTSCKHRNNHTQNGLHVPLHEVRGRCQ